MARIFDDDVLAVLESLSYFVRLERLSIFIKHAAYKKSRNVSLYRRTVRVSQIRIAKDIAHLKNREVNDGDPLQPLVPGSQVSFDIEDVLGMICIDVDASGSVLSQRLRVPVRIWLVEK